ncbi:MAG: NAD(P)/FAD-dependent oxidoreductase [Alphaproteobacteria bacterium]
MSTPERIVIVGAGHAGGAAVLALRALGYRGSIDLIGQEPHLPYERPPLSKELLQARPGMTFRPIKDRDWYDAQGVTLHLGETAVALDPKSRTITLAGGTVLSYDRLLLTTGGRVRRLDLPGSDLPGIHYLRTLDDSHALEPKLQPGVRVAVIGGGFIGLEVAASAKLRGAHVTVLEAADRLMARAVEPAVSAAFLALHSDRGVDIHLGTGLARFEGSESVERIVDANGVSLPVDLAVVGVGIHPEMEIASAAGLAVENGIVVDEYCRTSVPDIFAAGDNAYAFNPILGRHLRQESWQNAQNQAAAAARSMLGDLQPYSEHPWVWSDQFDANLQIAGAPDRWDETVFRGDPTGRDGFALFQLREGAVVGAQTVNRGRDMRFIRRLIALAARIDPSILADEAIPMKEIAK